MVRELGGYLPFELKNGADYFQTLPSEWVGRYDCGRTALYAAVLSLQVKVLWVPFFYCPNVLAMLEAMDIELKYYHISEQLMPAEIPVFEEETLLLVNYYGILDDKIASYIDSLKGGSRIIVDNAQAFFCKPVIRKGILNVYSCRKFIGVSDGAYLVGPGQREMESGCSQSFEYAQFLLKSLECGTNAAYAESLENEKRLGTCFRKMSKLTMRVLESVDYSYIKERRRNNFKYLHSRLKNCQHLAVVGEEREAYCYPLLLEEDLRESIIEEKVYVPTLWKELIKEEYKESVEYRLAKYVLCLPVDQRYGWEDMEYICSLVEKLRSCHGSC